MKIRKLRNGSEYFVIEDKGEFIKCPVCGVVWMKGLGGNTDFNRCPHLRFMFFEEWDEPFYFVGNWDAGSFQAKFQHLFAETEDADVVNVFRKLSHPEVDEVVYQTWYDSPAIHWIVYWGFQNEKQRPRTRTSIVSRGLRGRK
jgi:hypothetical protein